MHLKKQESEFRGQKSEVVVRCTWQSGLSSIVIPAKAGPILDSRLRRNDNGSDTWYLTPGIFFLPFLCFHKHSRMHLNICDL
jgi:hypothetical protein